MRAKIFWLISVFWLLLAASASAFYDPGLQRWINRDPIGEGGGLNLATFANNASVKWVDSFGLTITPEQDCKADYEKAKKYLEKSKTAKEAIKKLEDDPKEYRIKKAKNNDDRAKGDTVEWDPKSALVLQDGDTQSPALGLLHELGHLLHPGDDENNKDSKVMGLENQCASELEEGTREKHTDGRFFEVSDPTRRSPVPYDPRKRMREEFMKRLKEMQEGK